MGRDDLSQAEVEGLTGSRAPLAGQAAGLRSHGVQMPDRVPPAVAYDFRCAERLGPELTHGLESLHERAACDFAVALSSLARSAIAVHVAGVAQGTYAEFVRGLQNPTCLAVVDAEPLSPKLALDIGPAVIYPVIDRLLGAIHGTAPPLGRPLTEIERRLAGRIVSLMLDSLRRAWQDVIAVPFQLVRLETDPGRAAVALPSELVAMVRFDVSIGDVRGPMTCCLPRAAIDRVAHQLGAVEPMPNVAAIARRIDPAGAVKSLRAVELVAELAALRITTGELSDLRVGDVITTERNVDSPLVISVDGIPTFHARPGGFRDARQF